MQWARGILKRWQSAGGGELHGVIEPDPRVVFAAMAIGIIVGALLL
jgi:hypothetical protein